VAEVQMFWTDTYTSK